MSRERMIVLDTPELWAFPPDQNLLDGMPHSRGSTKCCQPFSRECHACGGRLHKQGSTFGLILVCEDCGQD